MCNLEKNELIIFYLIWLLNSYTPIYSVHFLVNSHLEIPSLITTSLVAQRVKHLPTKQKTWVWSLGWEDPLEKEMATHSSTLAWKIPWMEEPGGLQSMGSLRVGHDWVTSLSLSCIGEGIGNPLQCSCLENPRDGRAWWAAVYGVTQSWIRLKWLSNRSSSRSF